MAGIGESFCSRSLELSSGGYWGVFLSPRSLRDTIRTLPGARPEISHGEETEAIDGLINAEMA